MGIHPDEEYAKRSKGIYTFRVQGQIYHSINSLYPPEGKPSYLQLYFYDTENEHRHRQGKKDKLELPMIDQLINILEPNPYSRFFRSLQDIDDIDTYAISN